MSTANTIAFSCDLSLDENDQLKCLAEYNKRSMRGQFKVMIAQEYEQMKRDLK